MTNCDKNESFIRLAHSSDIKLCPQMPIVDDEMKRAAGDIPEGTLFICLHVPS